MRATPYNYISLIDMRKQKCVDYFLIVLVETHRKLSLIQLCRLGVGGEGYLRVLLSIGG